MVVDVVDTIMKPGNLADVGPTYLPMMGVMILGHAAAAFTENRRFHAMWVVFVILVNLIFSYGIWLDVFSGN